MDGWAYCSHTSKLFHGTLHGRPPNNPSCLHHSVSHLQALLADQQLQATDGRRPLPCQTFATWRAL